MRLCLILREVQQSDLGWRRTKVRVIRRGGGMKSFCGRPGPQSKLLRRGYASRKQYFEGRTPIHRRSTLEGTAAPAPEFKRPIITRIAHRKILFPPLATHPNQSSIKNDRSCSLREG